MRFAALAKPRHVPAARVWPIPPPVGGLNSQESISDMPEEDALLLENIFPEPDFVELRRGYESHATGLSTAVESLLHWAGPTSEKLFGAVTASIFEVTAAGAVGAAEIAGLTNGRWQQAMMTTTGGSFLVICNGADAVRNYDGSSWTTPTITGVSSAVLDNVWVFKERLIFVEENTLSLWNLGTKAIAGAAAEIPLGSVFKKGGKILAGGSLTRDGGAGADDLCIIVTSRGEVAVYQGTDPSSASTWALVGIFDIPPPIGKRCLQKAGGDLVVITRGGVISLSAMFVLDRAAQERAAVTSKINRLFTADARLHNARFGWQLMSYPRSNYFIVNVPTTEGSVSKQYVMNALTGAWCSFKGLNANCWALRDEVLYFGGLGTVWKADSTRQDNGTPITGNWKTAFSDLGRPGKEKTAQMLRALSTSSGQPGVLMDINVDYEDREPTSSPSPGPALTSVWGTATWGSGTWAARQAPSGEWFGAEGAGHTMSIRGRVVSDGASYTINGFEVLSTEGGII